MLIPVLIARLPKVYCDSKAVANAANPTQPGPGLKWVMVAKWGSGTDPMGPVLDALLKELEAAARDLSADDAEESERRAKTLAALSKVAESLSGLLRERRAEAEEQMSERSARDSAAQARDAEIWRQIEGRLARLRAAQDAAADRETAGRNEAGAAPP